MPPVCHRSCAGIREVIAVSGGTALQRPRRTLHSLQRLAIFEAVARLGSFSRAADELSLTQGAVSKHLGLLEQAMGATLLERGPRGVSLTTAGKRLYPRALQILEATYGLSDIADRIGQEVQPLHLAVLPGLAEHWLLPRLAAFRALHPGIEPHLHSRLEPFDLEDSRIDLALHYGDKYWPRGNCRFLFEEDILLIGPADLLKTPDLPARLAEGGVPRIHLSSRPHLWAEWLQMNGQEYHSSAGDIWVDQFNLAIAASRRGLGLALMPALFWNAGLAEQGLAALAGPKVSGWGRYYLVRPERAAENAAALAFETWLLSEAAATDADPLPSP